MGDKLMYIYNVYAQNYPFCRLHSRWNVWTLNNLSTATPPTIILKKMKIEGEGAHNDFEGALTFVSEPKLGHSAFCRSQIVG